MRGGQKSYRRLPAGQTKQRQRSLEAKAAVIQLTGSLAMELAKDKIRVNAISPGVVATPIFGRALGFDEKRTQETISEVGTVFGKYAPLERRGVPKDIANAVVFFCQQ